MFASRKEAGMKLAEKLASYKDANVVVLGIPRGGVAVAAPIAQVLHAELGVAVAKKLPLPGNLEFAIGAVAEDAVSMDAGYATTLGKEYVAAIAGQLRTVVRERLKAFSEQPPVKGRVAIIVDDGMATGHTVNAAVLSVRKKSPSKVVVAVPVASKQAVALVGPNCDELVILDTPEDFMGVGEFYRDFPQLSDEDVRRLLKK